MSCGVTCLRLVTIIKPIYYEKYFENICNKTDIASFLVTSNVIMTEWLHREGCYG